MTEYLCPSFTAAYSRRLHAALLKDLGDRGIILELDIYDPDDDDLQ